MGLPFVTEGIKWGNDLCFMVGGKMFCVVSLEGDLKISIKLSEEEFDDLINRRGIIPAPYSARYKWVLVEDVNVFRQKEWEAYIQHSYTLVKSKLSKKLLSGLK